MLWENDQIAPCCQCRSERLFICNFKRISVRCLSLLHLNKILFIGSWNLFVNDRLKSEHNVISRKLDAISPFHPFSQMKGYYKAILRNFPGLSEIADHTKISIILDQ